MADKSKKVKNNVSGKYYVDTNCTMCGACCNDDPLHFEDGGDYAYVKKQPKGDKEEETCRQSLENCPVDAIGDDGE